MNKEIVVGIDPSFTGTGLTIISSCAIKFYKISIKSGVKTFKEVSKASDLVSNTIRNLIPTSVTDIIMETPPPNSQFSAGLFALDSHIFNALSPLVEPKILPPSYIGHIHRY